ncbi:MAG TPA: EAL domain-containing protein [Alphaproteobacteria bacterium]|nr:EAL domain-containing protein [Alphaproteobacteria bacterium]
MGRLRDGETIRVLLVLRDGEALGARLSEIAGGGIVWTAAEGVMTALERLRNERWDAVLLDPSLPDAEGAAAVAQFREAAPDIAVLALGERLDENSALAFLEAGAQDCLDRAQATDDDLLRALRYAIERRRAEKRMAQLAAYDPLTGLVNRATLLHRLGRAIGRARRSGLQIAVFFIDLDGFKIVNDALGHAEGDELLKAVAARLTASVRGTDTVARLGGDEFALVLEGIADIRDVARIAEKLLHAIEAPIPIGGRETAIGASLGIALFPSSGWEPSALLRRADAAMYRAKQQGGGYHFFDAEMTTQAAERLTMERSLRRAIERDELLLHYQPQICPADGRVVAIEALVRWKHPEMGLIFPDRFLPLAEESGLIRPIGEWVLRRACEQFRRWQVAGLSPGRIAVNLSSRELVRRDPSDTLFQVLKTCGLDPGALELELTEGTLGAHSEGEFVSLSTLIAMGVRLAIDDFGTGYSSLGFLKRFPVDTLKIDGSFVRNLEREPWDTRIVTAVIGLAHTLGLTAVAEGVETAKQFAFLRSQGCDAVQGFHVCPPLPADEFTAWLVEREGEALAGAAVG